MNRLFCFLMFALSFCFMACTAGYDTFSESPYKTFDGIRFEEQNGDASVYQDEHLVKITLLAPPKNLSTWDSITVDSYDVSSLATIHLVDGKFKEFPSDSASLDSLAKDVSYVSRKIRRGDKIRVPQSQVVYIMVVAENGDPAIWQLNFTIPSVGISSNSNDGKSSSSEKVESSSSEEIESSSSIALLTGKELQVTFENQLKSNRSADSIYVKLNSDANLSEATLEKFVISEGASINPNPMDVKSWETPQTFKVTAEDESFKEWVVLVDIAAADEKASDEKELLAVTVDGADVEIINEKNLVTVNFATKKAASSAVVTLTISETASHNLPTESMDLTSEKKFDIMAEDGSSVQWSIQAIYPEPVPPRILSMKIDGNDAVVDSSKENGKMIYRVHYDKLDFLTDLNALKVSDIKLSDGASISGVENNSTYDLGNGVKAYVTNGEETVSYEIRGGYQYINNSFTTWKDNTAEGWSNGNTAGFNMTSPINNSAAKMQSMDAKILGIGQFASGNIFTGYFNPKGVSATKMMGYEDGNELIDFGVPFKARPLYVEVDFTYEGKNDSCDIYILLENRTAISNDGKNQYRSSTDVNTLVASAWYRSTTDDNSGRENPDVVSITDGESGFKTLRLKMKYGEPYENSPIYNSNTFKAQMASSNGIDNHLDKGDGSNPVTHLRVVMASSADGNHYKGTIKATLVVDEIRFIY